jgi:hypothetical protein
MHLVVKCIPECRRHTPFLTATRAPKLQPRPAQAHCMPRQAFRPPRRDAPLVFVFFGRAGPASPAGHLRWCGCAAPTTCGRATTGRPSASGWRGLWQGCRGRVFIFDRHGWVRIARHCWLLCGRVVGAVRWAFVAEPAHLHRQTSIYICDAAGTSSPQRVKL